MNRLYRSTRRFFLNLLLLICTFHVHASKFYEEPNMAANWTISSATNIASSNSNPSTGYTSSPQSPGASGAPGVIFQNCAHQSTNYTLTSGAISTMGRFNIRVGFGRSVTPAFNSTVPFQWSTNGTTWTTVTADVSAGATSAWSVLFYDLPAGANNQPSLYFRFQFAPGNNGACTDNKVFYIDDFTVGDNFNLPIQLAQFEVINEKNPRILWTTLAEFNNDFFSIQRSPDGIRFQEIGRIPGAGTTDAKREYNFVDLSALPGRNYYRLQQYDSDGSSSYSPVKLIRRPIKNDFMVFPSIFNDRIQLYISPEIQSPTRYEIFSYSGHLTRVGDLEAGIEQTELDLNDLQSGIYIIRLHAGNKNAIQKVIKLN